MMNGYYFTYNRQLYYLAEGAINGGFKYHPKGNKFIGLLIGEDMPHTKKQQILHSLINNKNLTNIEGKKIQR